MGQFCCSSTTPQTRTTDEVQLIKDHDLDGGTRSVHFETPGISTRKSKTEIDQGSLSMQLGGTCDGNCSVQSAGCFLSDELARRASGVSSSGVDDSPSGGGELVTRHDRWNLTRVAAGHGGATILKYFDKTQDDSAGIPDYVIKAYDEGEAAVYNKLEASDDPLLPFTPRFHGVVDSKDLDQDLGPDAAEKYMRLSNLLKKFKRGPHVMDCKLGVRSFGEKEVTNTKPRADLFKKLMALDPSAATEEEMTAGACTKYRWMSINDGHTTLRSLGFRIDGIAHSGDSQSTPKAELKSIASINAAAQMIIKSFLPTPKTFVDVEEIESDSEDDNEWRQQLDNQRLELQRQTADMVLNDLRELRRVMSVSPFVKTNSFVGCSLLFMSDAHGPGAGVFLIDFAKITPVPEGTTIDHLSPWTMGNHEDGLFLGMDNIIKCWEEVSRMCTVCRASKSSS